MYHFTIQLVFWTRNHWNWYHQIGIVFITFTCARLIPLFEITGGFQLVYTFFDKLKSNGHFVNSYIIMPDHPQAILSFTHTEKSINRIIGDGNQFISCEFVNQLKDLNELALLDRLSGF